MWAYAALAAAQLIGGFQQAGVIRQNAEIQSSINNMNARYQELDAYNANNAGFSESARYESVVDSTIGAQKTAYASQDVSVNYGTAAEVQADSKITGMLNTLEIQRQGREKALGYQMQAINTRLGGQMTKLQGEIDAGSAQLRGVLGAGATLLSGYERWNSTGKGFSSRSGSNSKPDWRQSDSSPASSGWFFGPANRATTRSENWYFEDDTTPHAQPTFNA